MTKGILDTPFGTAEREVVGVAVGSEGERSGQQNLLIVDDDQRITELVGRLAENQGWRVKKLNTSQDFTNTYDVCSPGLVVLDLNLPGVDGIQLLEYVALQPRRASVILLSGADGRVLKTARDLAVALGLNVVGVLKKPFEISALVEMLTSKAHDRCEPTLKDLDQAIASKEIQVFYQQKIELETGQLLGAEALARWNHPRLGVISPAQFVPMAEAGGSIGALTDLVFEEAMRALVSWDATVPNLQVSVNLSPAVLSDSDRPDRFEESVRSMGLNPERLILEVTESAAMMNPTQAMAILSRFRLKGFKFAIDDFGTGASSLVQLYRMPFSEIKIDQSFVRDLIGQEEARVIVDSIVHLGHRMGMVVVAEGIEDRETLNELVEMGCEQGQGFFFSKPISGGEFLGRLNGLESAQ